MATGVDAGGTWNTTAGNKTVVATPAVGDLIVVVHGMSGWASGDDSVVTDNNSDGLGTYTRIGTATAPLSNGGGTAGALWISVRNKLIGSASSTTFTVTNTGDTGGGLTVLRFSGMQRTGLDAIKQSIGESGATESPPTITFASTTNTNNPVILACMGEDNPIAITPPTGFTEADDTGWATPTAGIEVCWDDAGNAATLFSWTGGATTDHNEVGLELDISPPPLSHEEALKVNRRKGWRKLQPVILSHYAQPPIPFQYPSLVLEKAFRRHGKRQFKKAIDPGSFSAHTLYTTRLAAEPFSTRILRSRTLKRAPDVPAGLWPTPGATTPLIATIRQDAYRRNGWRKAQTAVPVLQDIRLAPAFPAYAGTLCKRMRSGQRRLQSTPSLDWLVSTPPEAPSADAIAAQRPRTNRRPGLRRDVREFGFGPGFRVEPPVPATPPAYALPKFHRRHQKPRDIELLEVITANPVQPKPAWTPGPVFRRFGHRHFLQAIPVWKKLGGNVGLGAETDTASALGLRKGYGVGLLTETDTAFGLGGLKAKTVTLASSIDTAFNLGRVKARLVAVLAETDIAGALLGSHPAAIGRADSTETAFALDRVKLLTFLYCEETDTAYSLVLFPTPGVALEEDAAQALGAVKAIAAGLGAETDAALGLSAVHSRETGLAISVNSAVALNRLKAKIALYGTETDTAFALIPMRIYLVRMAQSTETAFALSPRILANWTEGSATAETWAEDTLSGATWTEASNSTTTWTE